MSDRHSLYPKAMVARLDAPARGRLSATLCPRMMGYLSVRVTFHRRPVVGLELRFHECDDAESAQAGAVVGTVRTTDANGVAFIDFQVPAGLYVCQLQNQPPTVVHTVDDELQPLPLITPIGRPYFEYNEEREFDRHIVTDAEAHGVDAPAEHGLED